MREATPRAAESRWSSPVLLAVATLLFFGPWVLHGDVPYYGDLLLQFYPGQVLTRAADFPLWNPYVVFGIPYAARPHSGSFYPPNMLVFRLLPIEWGTVASIMGHLLVAGLGMYAFLRALGLERGPAILGALTFMFSARFVAHVSHIARLQTQAWLPLIMLATHRVFFPGGLELSACLAWRWAFSSSLATHRYPTCLWDSQESTSSG